MQQASLMSTEADRCQAMIDGQLRPNRITDDRIIDAFASVSREMFMPKALKGVAYLDEDVEVAPDRYLMEPLVFARLLLAAQIKADDIILDIGCLNGYSSAVLAALGQTVVALETGTEQTERAASLLSDHDVSNAVCVEGALESGFPKEAPYDVIVIEGAVEHIPPSIIDQLNEGGRLVTVLSQNGVGKIFCGEKRDGGLVERLEEDAATPILPGFEKPASFAF
ncbi:MAG: protein-L-isoaspartate O-methyltransferase [Pseudomonadota bacterium]